MKKAILIIAATSLSLHGIGQEKYVTSAAEALYKKDFDEAKDDIDKAMSNSETKDKPKALYLKANIYLNLQNVEKYKATNPYREGAQALYRLIEVKPDYEKSDVNTMLGNSMYLYYNDGARAYNDKKFTEVDDYMHNVLKIYNLKRFEKLDVDKRKKIDTVAAEAEQAIANCAYDQGKYDEAITLLTKVKNNNITRKANVFECLIDAQERQGKKEDALATIQEGRKEFPDDVVMRNKELNYYILSGKQDEMVKKMEEAATKDPNNAEIQFNIATTYLNMANPKDGKKPANYTELMGKSEESFQKAVKISPDNAVYNYNFGALYFNQAVGVTAEMNALGTSDADTKKYDGLKEQQTGLFVKATPYFEKAASVYASNEKNLKVEERNSYKTTLKTLMELYSRQSKMDKYGETKKKYDAM